MGTDIADRKGGEHTAMASTLTPEQAIRELRRILPASSDTARAIDRGEPWHRTAMSAVNDGYITQANELREFIEACLKKGILREM